MAATLAELCATLEQYGMKPALRGDAARPIKGVATLEDAGPGEVTFLSNPKYEKLLQTTRATAVVLRPGVAAPDHLALVQVDDPYAAVTALIVKLHGYRLHRRLPPSPAATSIHETARIGASATVHPGVTIEHIQSRTGFPITIAPDAHETPRPTASEVRLLREVIDPLGVRKLETLSGPERWALLRQIADIEAGG